MRKTILLIIAILSLSACSGVRNLGIEGYRIADLTTEGLSSVGATLVVKVDNPGKEMILREISGTVNNDGKHIADFSTTAPALIPARSVSDCAVSCRLGLAPGISAMSLLFGGLDKDSITVDAVIKMEMPSGIVRKFKVKGLTLEQISSLIAR